MSRERLIAESLSIWQDDVYEEIETPADIKVFNTVGTIVGLLGRGMIKQDNLHTFITEVLELTKEEKEAVYHLVIEGTLYAVEKEAEGSEEV